MAAKHVLTGAAGTLLLASLFLDVPDGMGDKGLAALALLVLAIALWSTEWLPAPVTSLLIVALAPMLGLLPYAESAAQLGHEMIWLILAMLMMGAAVGKLGLDKRLAYWILRLSGGRPNRMVAGLIGIGFVLTFFVPNAMGRLSVLLPIGNGMIGQMGKQAGGGFAKAVTLAMTFVPYVSTIAVMTAASGSIYAVGLFRSILDYQWTYLYWMAVMMPIVLVVLCGLWLILIRLFPSDAAVVEGGTAYFQAELQKMGGVTREEWKLLALYAVLIGLWMTHAYHGMSISLCALAVVIFLFFPGMRLLSWKEAGKEVDWGVPLIFAAGFVLSASLVANGVVAWLSAWTTQFLGGLAPAALAAAIMAAFTAVRLVFTSLTSMVASLLPVALTFALSTDYNPVWIGAICLIASSIAFLLPTQSVGSLTTFATGRYTGKELFISGGWLTLLLIAASFAAAMFYWPLIGLHY